MSYLKIKKTFVLSVFVSLAILIGMSKSIAQPHIGINFGSVSTEFVGDYFVTSWDYQYVMDHSYQAGLLIDIPVKKDISISFNPGYKKLHGIFQVALTNLIAVDPDEDAEPSWADHTKLRIDYLILPISIKIFSDNKRWEFTAGFEPAIALSRKKITVATGEKADISSDWRPFNFSVIFGIGYRFRIGSQQFVYGGQWSQGVTNITAGLNTEVEFPRIKSSTYESRLIWYLPFSKSTHDIVKKSGRKKNK